jgi:7-cyano-7-deazaguanine synthase
MGEARMRAVVLLSGGMDSATCLAMARRDGCECHALSFDYGQRHRRTGLPGRWPGSSASGTHPDHRPGDFGGSALTDERLAVPTRTDAGSDAGIPITYVPARNTVFLAFALGLAEVLDADRIYAGMNAVDYSGYPDCRPAYLEAFQQLANLATKRGVEGRPIVLHAPLLRMSKAEIVRHGLVLGVDFAATVSCYQATAAGEACGNCDACRLRKAGFAAAGVADPTRYR